MDELESDVFLWNPTHDATKLADQQNIYIHQFCVDIGCGLQDLFRAMNDRNGWWVRVRGLRVIYNTWWWWWWWLLSMFCFYIESHRHVIAGVANLTDVFEFNPLWIPVTYIKQIFLIFILKFNVKREIWFCSTLNKGELGMAHPVRWGREFLVQPHCSKPVPIG